ncbi:aldehyde ferredoxin oxidoreductase N-terminal domain-containing protein [Chloroflexota bacterium]
MAEYGWVGKILIVDLTSGVTSTVATGKYVPKFIGGRALAAKLYWDEVPPDCGAFSPENRLIFATGPASGTLGAASTRTAIVTKSPELVPECYLHSSTGGHWGAELKFAGFDAVIVRGKAAKPVYIWIHNGEAEILKAERLWGLNSSQVDTEIRRLWGDQSRSMIIGPAGENLVKTATIATELGHAAGLGGFGSVMGSKNLKAIVVRGTGGVKIARPKELIDFYDENVRIGGKYGGPYPISAEAYGIHHGQNNLKDAGVSEEQIGKQTDGIEDRFGPGWGEQLYLAYEEVAEGTIKSKFAGCFACSACCDLAFQPKDPTGKEKKPKDLNPTMTVGQQCFEYTSWNEFEALEFDGKRVGRPSILNYSSHQEMGISMTDMGYHLLWFLDAIREGLLTSENTGLPIGDYNSPEFMGLNGYSYGITYRRNDFFRRLAEGQQRFLEDMAQESVAWKNIYEKYVYIPRYHGSSWSGSPPSDPLFMLGIATGLRRKPNNPLIHFMDTRKSLTGFLPPAELLEAKKAAREKFAALLGPKSVDLSGEDMTFEGKVPALIFFQNMEMETDSIPHCGYAGFPRWYSLWTPDHVGDPSDGAKMLAAITGIDRPMEENVKAMEVAWTLERAIRAREGHRRKHDWFNDYVFEINKSWTSKSEFSSVLDEYYTMRGWDVVTGIPTRSKLEELGLEDVADDLEKKYGVAVSY